jgi:hypothetical protein
MAEEPERDDPVLVRPYITTQPAGDAPGPDDRTAAQTWPATADLPEDGTREIAVVPAPVATPDAATRSTALRRQRLMVLAGICVLALLGGAALVLLLPSDDDDNPPVNALPAPVAPSVTGSLGVAPVASGGTRNASPTSRAASRSAAAPRSATSPVPGRPAQPPATPAPPSGAPSATLSPPPDPARTGAITAAGGRCLNLGALLPVGGGPVQTAGCSNVSYQRWTMASDGTLQVVDRCARVRDDGQVRIGDCDDQAAGQWRAGPDGSLVNPETGRCLTDPGAALATVTVTDCTGAADQRWTLP